jgi:hypothetical protein
MVLLVVWCMVPVRKGEGETQGSKKTTRPENQKAFALFFI